MSLAIVRDRRSNGAKGGPDIPREVNVYVTSRLNGGEGGGGGRKVCDYTSAWNHNSRMLIRCVSIARALDRYPLGSRSSRASRRQYLPTSRYNFESANEEKRRSRVHGRKRHSEQKGRPSISRHNIDTHFPFNPPGNFLKQTLRRANPSELFSRDRLRLKTASLSPSICPSLPFFLPFVRIIPVAQPHRCNGKIIPDTIYDVREIHSFSAPLFPFIL